MGHYVKMDVFSYAQQQCGEMRAAAPGVCRAAGSVARGAGGRGADAPAAPEESRADPGAGATAPSGSTYPSVKIFYSEEKDFGIKPTGTGIEQ